jgi:hypothetical protein
MAIPTQDPGFAGMKADSGDDRVESFAVGIATLGFGLVVASAAAGSDVVGLPGAGSKVRGISLHSHAIPGPAYVLHDCVSVMTRGLVWAKVTGAATKDGPVSFQPDGTVGDAAGTLLPNAVFRSGKVATADGDIAVVELHAPFSETT